MNKDEIKLLLYFESRAVDHCGGVNPQYMNTENFQIAEKWNAEKFIKFGRISGRTIMKFGGMVLREYSTHYVVLSYDAWNIAHQERKKRAERMWKKQRWFKTADED